MENENRSMETVDTGALQNEVEKVMVWSIFAELFDFWLKIRRPYVAHFLSMGYSYIRLILNSTTSLSRSQYCLL